MSLRGLLAAPRLAGNDLSRVAPETLALLRNPEVIAVHQGPLGVKGHRVAQEGQLEVGVKPPARGSKELGLFNRDESVMPGTAYFRDVGAGYTASVGDLWEKSDMAFLSPASPPRWPPTVWG